MILIAHVIIALASVVFTTYGYITPSASKLHVVYGLAALTLASGLYLVWSAPAHMLQACTAGVVYICVVTVGIVATHRKLIAAKATS